jgi:hypothetical protein
LLSNALFEDRPITVVPFNSDEHTKLQKDVQTEKEEPKKIEKESSSVIAPILAAGYMLGSDAITKVKELDEKAKISQSVITATDVALNKVKEVDKQLKISSTVENISKQVDDSLKISQNVNAAMKSVSDTVDSGYVMVKDAPVVQSAVQNLSGIGQTISNFFAPPAGAIQKEFEDIQTQTRDIIEKKEAEQK